MTDRWMLRGTQFANCNCDWGCPCQFNSSTTHGYCEAIEAGHIEAGNFNGTRLDGLNYVMLVQWPGEIADGKGRVQFIIDERADEAQRDALEKIMRGESTAPGATHFYVFNSTMTEVLDPIFAPIALGIDVAGRSTVRRQHRPKPILYSSVPNSTTSSSASTYSSGFRRPIPCSPRAT